MVTITKHVVINIFQTDNFPAVKFAMGFEKNGSFLVIWKFPKDWKKVKKSDWPPFILHQVSIMLDLASWNWNPQQET